MLWSIAFSHNLLSSYDELRAARGRSVDSAEYDDIVGLTHNYYGMSPTIAMRSLIPGSDASNLSSGTKRKKGSNDEELFDDFSTRGSGLLQLPENLLAPGSAKKDSLGSRLSRISDGTCALLRINCN